MTLTLTRSMDGLLSTVLGGVIVGLILMAVAKYHRVHTNLARVIGWSKCKILRRHSYLFASGILGDRAYYVCRFCTKEKTTGF